MPDNTPIKLNELRIQLQTGDGSPKVLSLEFTNPIEVLGIISRLTEIAAHLIEQTKTSRVIQHEKQMNLDLDTSQESQPGDKNAKNVT